MIVVSICYFGANWIKENDGYENIRLKDVLSRLSKHQYDMELKFKFNEHESISMSPIRIYSDTEANYLFLVNQNHTTPLCVTLVKDVVEGNSDGEDHNGNDFWDTMEIAREDDVVIPETDVPHRDLAVTRRIPSIVHDNKNENEFPNEDLFALSSQRHEQGGTSGLE